MSQYQPLAKESFYERTLTDVVLNKDGFEIKHGAMCFYISNDKNQKKVTPKIGDVALFYGDGPFRPVLGLQINDQMVFFTTREEHKRKVDAWIKSNKENSQREYLELMEKIKDEPSFETISVSGFGGDYERACQLMIQAGVKFLDENEFHFDYQTISGVYGLCFSDAPWSKDLEKVLLEAVDGDCTGAMHQCVIGHLQKIKEHGYEWWVNHFPEERRYMYPSELPPPPGGVELTKKSETNSVYQSLVAGVLNTIPKRQRVLNWFDYWFLCPHDFSYSLEGILNGLGNWFGYPHDFAWEDNKLICTRCGFRGLYVIGGIFDKNKEN